jgi:hypothetical protein
MWSKPKKLPYSGCAANDAGHGMYHGNGELIETAFVGAEPV